MSILEKAKALLVLRGALGDLYQTQRRSLLDQVLLLPGGFSEAATVLSELNAIGFIESPTELGVLTEKLLSSTTSSSSSTPSSSTSSYMPPSTTSSFSSSSSSLIDKDLEAKWNALLPTSLFVDASGKGALEVISKKLPQIDPTIEKSLFLELFGQTLGDLLNVTNIRDALGLLANDDGYGVLEELLTPQQVSGSWSTFLFLLNTENNLFTSRFSSHFTSFLTLSLLILTSLLFPPIQLTSLLQSSVLSSRKS
jgi:hypothetical protein